MKGIKLILYKMKILFHLVLILLFNIAKCELKYERWMEDNKEYLLNKTLLDVIIPGTHDSGILLIKL